MRWHLLQNWQLGQFVCVDYLGHLCRSNYCPDQVGLMVSDLDTLLADLDIKY